MPQHANAEQDEFDAAAEAAVAVSGYEATRGAPVEDQREYTLVPRNTPCTLKVLGFELATQNPAKPAIICRLGVTDPGKFSNGASTFSIFLSLNATIGEGKKSSGWIMTVQQLSWMYAAANQVASAEGKAKLIDAVLDEFPNLELEDYPAFHAMLVQNANEQLKGATFKTKIGVQLGKVKPGQEGKLPADQEKYPDKQTIGQLDYPRSSK
jgi:hypothetical protein